jgi:hypothetical protein
VITISGRASDHGSQALVCERLMLIMSRDES